MHPIRSRCTPVIVRLQSIASMDFAAMAESEADREIRQADDRAAGGKRRMTLHTRLHPDHDKMEMLLKPPSINHRERVGFISEGSRSSATSGATNGCSLPLDPSPSSYSIILSSFYYLFPSHILRSFFLHFLASFCFSLTFHFYLSSSLSLVQFFFLFVLSPPPPIYFFLFAPCFLLFPSASHPLSRTPSPILRPLLSPPISFTISLYSSQAFPPIPSSSSLLPPSHRSPYFLLRTSIFTSSHPPPFFSCFFTRPLRCSCISLLSTTSYYLHSPLCCYLFRLFFLTFSPYSLSHSSFFLAISSSSPLAP